MLEAARKINKEPQYTFPSGLFTVNILPFYSIIYFQNHLTSCSYKAPFVPKYSKYIF